MTGTVDVQLYQHWVGQTPLWWNASMAADVVRLLPKSADLFTVDGNNPFLRDVVQRREYAPGFNPLMIPASRMKVPGIIAPLVNLENGEVQAVLIDGAHRAARAVATGESWSCYYLLNATSILVSMNPDDPHISRLPVASGGFADLRQLWPAHMAEYLGPFLPIARELFPTADYYQEVLRAASL